MKLSSVLTNLIKNSLKFTKSGYLEFGCQLEDDIIYFYVKDTGKGIPENRIPYIFDRFVQADFSFSKDYEGSGLGLSISKAYVEMMGGKITVESEVGKGSIFSFSIPYNPIKSAIEVPSLEETRENIYLGKKILIAEDDDISYIYTSTILNHQGNQLERAYNGEEAVEMCRNNDFSAILMDIKMPLMDGYQATQLIREFNQDIPIIALTAFAFSDDREKALAQGCTDYLSKPVKKEHLVGVLEKYC
jgi:CheY-like chemotaxis protein